MAGEIDISKLTGVQRAMGQAADLDKSGKIDNALEKSIYNDLVGDAGMDATVGLRVQKYPTSLSDQIKQGKQDEKDAKKAYKKMFGNLAAEVEKTDDKANDRVADFVKNAKIDSEKLNAAVASRPNPMKYVGKGAEYMQELESWVTRVISCGSESVVEEVNRHSDENTEKVLAKIDSAFNDVIKEINEGKAEILQTIDEATGEITDTIKTSTGEVIKVVKDASGQVIKVVRQEGNRTRDLVAEFGFANLSATQAWGNFNAALTKYYGEQNLSETRYQGYTTRANSDYNHAKTREHVDQKAKASQIADEQNAVISGNILRGYHNPSTMDALNKMRDKIEKSNLSDAVKQELRQDIINLTQQAIYKDADIDKINKKIDEKIANGG